MTDTKKQSSTNKPRKSGNWHGKSNITLLNVLEVDKESVILNGERNKRLVVSKYMPLSRFCESVGKSNFTFVSPVKWTDPFEMLFYHPNVQINDDYYTVNICCFASNDIENEEGFWNIWGMDSSDKIIRVTYDVTNLLEELSYNSDMNFYLGPMHYITRDMIQSQAKNSNSRYNKIEDYLKDLCLKRDAYKYEIELRLFVVHKTHNISQLKDLIYVDIDYSKSVVAEVTLPPAKPLGNSHPAKALYKCIQDTKNLQAINMLEKLISTGKLKCNISQSALYCPEIRERVYFLKTASQADD